MVQQIGLQITLFLLLEVKLTLSHFLLVVVKGCIGIFFIYFGSSIVFVLDRNPYKQLLINVAAILHP